MVGLDVKPAQDEGADELLRHHKSNYLFLEADITDDNVVKDAVNEAQRFLGGSINSLVNNAGLAMSGMAEDPADRLASYQRFLAVNLAGVLVKLQCLKGSLTSDKASVLWHCSDQEIVIFLSTTQLDILWLSRLEASEGLPALFGPCMLQEIVLLLTCDLLT